MKICRYGKPGEEKPGVIDQFNQLRDLSSLIEDVTPQTLGIILENAPLIAKFPLVEGTPRLGAPITGISKFIGIGLNYTEHAREANLPKPDEPIVFFKAPSSINGPDDAILAPPNSRKLDWEAELGIVISRKAKRVSQAEAQNYIAGYCIVNDVSDREFQFQSSQWDKGKSYDTFGPIGPFIVTSDEVPDPQKLDITLEVNGICRQSSSTADMIFSVNKIVSYLSHYMTLLPGDIIATGTPAGVGMGHKPLPIWLQAGDRIKIHISGLGTQNQLVQFEDP